MMLGFGYIKEYRARGERIEALEWQCRQSRGYRLDMEEKVKHLRRKFHHADDFNRALKGKMAKYERATLGAVRVLREYTSNVTWSATLEEVAVALRQAYDAPIEE